MVIDRAVRAGYNEGRTKQERNEEMKRTKYIAWGLACVLLTGCAGQRELAQQALENSAQENRHEATTFAMDTIMTFTIIDEDGEELLIDAEQEIRRLEQLFSITMADSEVSRLNAAAGQEAVSVSPDTLTLLQTGKEMSAETDGAFDLTISPIVRAWGFETEEKHVPTQAELDALLPLVDAGGLELDAETGTAFLTRAGMAVDLGGIAKGYAADSVAALLREKGVTSALFSLGGNLYAVGTKPDGEKWEAAVANPLDATDYYGIFTLSDQALVTSNGYQRYFEQDGKRYHHIIDPKTGYPAESGLASVTVLCENSTKADALSTALYVMGLEEALAYWRSHGDFEAVFLTDEGEVIATEGAAACFTFEGRDNDFTYRIAEKG